MFCRDRSPLDCRKPADVLSGSAVRFAVLARAAVLGGLLLATPATADPIDDTLVFGGDAAYPPFEWHEDGRVRGFYVELARALGTGAGVTVHHRLGSWPDTVRALEAGDVDVVAMFASEERAKSFSFTEPFFFVNHGVYAQTSADDISSLHDLDGRRVAVEELSYAHQQLLAEQRPVTLVLEPNTVAALDAVVAERADYAVLASPTARLLIRNRGLPLRRVAPPLWPRGYAFAVHRERPELAAWLDARLEQVLRDGTYQQIYARWEQDLEPGNDAAVGWTAAALTLFVCVVLLAAWVYRQRLAQARLRHTATTGESRAQWAADHDVYTELPRLHVFVNRVEAILARTPSAERRDKRVVAVKPASLEKTIRARGHAAGIDVAKGLVERLRSLELEVYGQTGRDVFLLFGDSEQIDRKLRSIAISDDTAVLSAATGPMLVVGSAAAEVSDAAELVRRAETALSCALERHEVWVEYRVGMDPDAVDLKLVELFRETRGAGVHALFQPQVDIRSGSVVGAEALARWEAPGFGLVSPAKFVPLLEDSGLVKHLTSRMIAEGARVGAALRKRGYACPISVNVSVSDLLGTKTRRSVFKHLRAQRAMPQDLKLELTETSVAENPDALRLVLQRLRDSGIRISVDDFGTGYSSLSYLRDLPVDEVKIDQSFMRAIADKREHRSIVRSMIHMAHDLGLTIVAEGVEHESCLQVLREDGCDTAQGYLIAKPLPEDELISFVAAAGSAQRAGEQSVAESARR